MFEKFLENYFTEVEVSVVLDDNLPDAFSAWLVELDVDKLIELGDEFAQEEVEKAIMECKDKTIDNCIEVVEKEENQSLKFILANKVALDLEKLKDIRVENEFLCKVCKKKSVATKPTIYKNCPCGGEVKHLNK